MARHGRNHFDSDNDILIRKIAMILSYDRANIAKFYITKIYMFY